MMVNEIMVSSQCELNKIVHQNVSIKERNRLKMLKISFNFHTDEMYTTTLCFLNSNCNFELTKGFFKHNVTWRFLSLRHLITQTLKQINGLIGQLCTLLQISTLHIITNFNFAHYYTFQLSTLLQISTEHIITNNRPNESFGFVP